MVRRGWFSTGVDKYGLCEWRFCDVMRCNLCSGNEVLFGFIEVYVEFGNKEFC